MAKEMLNILQVDNMTAPTDGHNTTGQFNPALHKANGNWNTASYRSENIAHAELLLGVVDISVPGVSLAIDPRGLNASQELPQEFPFNLDYNSGDTIGFSACPYSIRIVRLTNLSC